MHVIPNIADPATGGAQRHTTASQLKSRPMSPPKPIPPGSHTDIPTEPQRARLCSSLLVILRMFFFLGGVRTVLAGGDCDCIYICM